MRILRLEIKSSSLFLSSFSKVNQNPVLIAMAICYHPDYYFFLGKSWKLDKLLKIHLQVSS